MKQLKVPVSIIVPVKNEEQNLGRCLASARRAEDIYVVDSHSTDATGAIAQNFGAQVGQFDFADRLPKKKEWALRT